MNPADVLAETLKLIEREFEQRGNDAQERVSDSDFQRALVMRTNGTAAAWETYLYAVGIKHTWEQAPKS